MYDSPRMPPRPESPHPPFAPFVEIAPRHHTKGRGYSVWREHGTHDWLLKQTVSGQGRFGFGEAGELIVKAGDAVLIRPGTRHDYGVEPSFERWELVWAHFRPRPGWLEWLKWPEVAPGLMGLSIADLSARRQLEEQLFEVNRLARSPSPKREAFAMNALEKALMLYDDHNPLTAVVSFDPRLTVVMERMRAHPTESYAISELTRLSGLSSSRLYTLFAEQVGQTPHEFLEYLRIDEAKRLLELTPRRVQQIALEVGFEDPLYFSRRFKRRTGLSPREYRQRIDALPRSSVIDLE